LTTKKAKDMTMDFRGTRKNPSTVSTLGEEEEVVEDYRYLRDKTGSEFCFAATWRG